ncbi:MAG: hypothetical protein KGH72_00450 [Candidatus Micrarchaeota archaeon]|nr:hypothetical protein [Candidatus Micrarchaeota archaeon]
MSVFDVVWDAFNILKNYPVVIVPYLILIGLSFIVGLILAVAIFASVAQQFHSGNALFHSGNMMANLTQNYTLNATNSSFNSTFAGTAAGRMAMESLLQDLWVLLPSLIIVVLIFYVIGVFINIMYIDMAAQAFAKKPVLGAAFDTAVARFLSVLGLSLIYLAVYLIVFGILALLLFGTQISAITNLMSSAGSGANTGQWVPLLVTGVVFVILALVIGIILGILLYNGYAVAVLERLGPVDAFKKSIDIGRKRFWNILGLFALIILITLGYIAVYFLISLIPVIGSIIDIVLSIVFGVWSTMLPATFYMEYVKGTRPKFSK